MLPEGLLSAFALATVTTVMVSLGLDLRPGEFLEVWRRPGMLLKALFSALVGVPAIALAVTRIVHLPWAADVGLVLMAVSPGAPLALQRSLGAGALRAFAPGFRSRLRSQRSCRCRCGS